MTALLGPQLPVHVKRKRHTESDAYVLWWWLTTYSENLVSMEPQLLVQLMVSTVTQLPALEIFTWSATLYCAKMVHVPSRISM